MTTHQVTILLVEDDDAEILLLQRALRHAKIANPVVSALDGVEALEHLRGTGGRDRIARPFLILLDLNMPRMNGIELLAELRNDPELADAIVFVLTTSDSDRDRCAAYAQNVAGYILKDNVGNDFLDLIAMLDGYWRVVEFPEGTRGRRP